VVSEGVSGQPPLRGDSPWRGNSPYDRPMPEFRAVWCPRDYEATVAFYRDALGLEQVGGWDRGPNDQGALLAAASGIIELIKLPAGEPYVAPAGVSLYVEVDDVDALHAGLEAVGIAAAVPRDRPWGHRQLSITDPDGIPIAFFTPIG
jgi:catechol 2,3-dioxygenase-like lactoylglutathione lyase family enzyme